MLEPYQRALATSEARFRNLIQKNADGMLVVRRDGIIGFVNPAAEELLGRRAEDLIGKPFGAPLLPGRTTEVEVPHGTGVRVAEIRVVEIEWEGELAHLASLRDVTEARQTRDALQFLANASRSLAGSLDPASTIASIGRLAVAHLADWCFLDLLEPDGRVRRHVTGPGRDTHALEGIFAPAATRGSVAVILEGQLEIHDPATPEVLSALALAPEQESALRALGAASVLIVPLTGCEEARDRPRPASRLRGAMTLLATRTGRRFGPAERALACNLAQRAAVALENAAVFHEWREATHRRDEYLAVLAHELRNPLWPLLNAAQLLQQGVADPAQRRTLDVIQRQGRHIAQLLDDLFDLSRVTHGKIELRKQPLDLAGVVTDVVQGTRSLIEERQHHLVVSLAPGPLHVEGDPTRLEQVVANLLINAAKYTDPGGRIELSMTADADCIMLRVSDNGRGISPLLLQRIFEPFMQVDASLDRQHGGLGLGLTLVRSLVELHGGSVSAASPGPGQGSAFTVRLPRLEDRPPPPPEKPAPATPPVIAPRSVVATSAPGQRRVLLVEDNRDGREMLRDLMRLWGYEVEETGNGLDAFERLRSRMPDCALVDIGLPGVDGYQLARMVRQLPGGRRITLIAITGYGQPEDRQQALDAGYDAHLVKPVDLDTLQRLLEQRADVGADG
jgi:signal transduction histidine kinase/ActR/RegA family two-component response regulator